MASIRGPYNNLQAAISGLLYGVDGRQTVESWRAGENIDFGDPVFTYEAEDYSMGGGSVWKVKQDTSTITLDADLVTSNVITTTVTVDGVAQTPVATTFDTDHDTTMDNHVTDLEAAISGLEVSLTDSTNNRQFTLLIKGSNIDLVTSVVTLGASQAGITIAYTNSQIFVGFALFTQKSLKDTVGYYEEDEAINVMTHGQLWSNTSVAVSANIKAYVIWAVGATQGQLTNVATDNYDINTEFRSSTSGADLVLVNVNGQKRDATP